LVRNDITHFLQEGHLVKSRDGGVAGLVDIVKALADFLSLMTSLGWGGVGQSCEVILQT